MERNLILQITTRIGLLAKAHESSVRRNPIKNNCVVTVRLTLCLPGLENREVGEQLWVEVGFHQRREVAHQGQVSQGQVVRAGSKARFGDL